jgi:hypothetical protein
VRIGRRRLAPGTTRSRSALSGQHDGWGIRANYTFSVRKDNQFGEGNSLSPNPQGAVDNFNLEREFGYSLIDAPHRFNISGTLELPFGEGKHWLSRGGVLATVLGGWAVSGVGFYQSGFPVVVSQASNPALAFGFGQRPNIVTAVDPQPPGSPEDNYDATCNCIRWLDPAAWSAAPAFTLGDAPRADVRTRTPMRKNWDIALQKTHAVGGSRVTLRAELINVFDDPAFFGPRVGYGLGTFGQITAVGGFPRTLQLSARIAW